MPLPRASRLHIPHPLPVTPAENARNLDDMRLWADRLPFFGPTHIYMLRPSFGTKTIAALGTPTVNQTPSPASGYLPITWDWVDLYDSAVGAAYPFCSTLATNGAPATGLLRLPYRKTEAFTSIRIDLSWSAFSGASTTVALLWVLTNIDDNVTGYTTALPASNAPWLCGPGEYLASRMEFSFVTAGQIVPFAPNTTIIPPHDRGWWALELRVGASPNNISFNEECTLQVVIQETLDVGAGYPDKVLPLV